MHQKFIYSVLLWWLHIVQNELAKNNRHFRSHNENGYGIVLKWTFEITYLFQNSELGMLSTITSQGQNFTYQVIWGANGYLLVQLKEDTLGDAHCLYIKT